MKIPAERLRALAARTMDPPVTLAEGAAMAAALLKRKPKKARTADPARELRAALEHVRALDLSPSLSLLSYAVVSGAILRATDLHCELEIAIPDLGGSGLLSIPDASAALKGASGLVTWDGASALEVGSSSVRLLPPPLVEDYPAMSWGAAIEEPPPVAEGETPWSADEVHEQDVDAVRLLARLAAVEHAMSSDWTRPHIAGALLMLHGGGHVDAAATDGHRLAVTDFTREQGRADLFIPRRAVELYQRLAKGARFASVRVRWAWFGRSLEVRGGSEFRERLGRVEVAGQGWRLRSRIPDEHFPPYQKVVPRAGVMRLDLPRAPLMRALEALAALKSRTGNTVLEVSEDGSTLMMSRESPDSGMITHRVPVQLTGERFATAVNAPYLRDAVGSIMGDTIGSVVVIDAGTSKDGALDPIRVWSPAAPLDMRVVMPCRM